MGTNSTSALTYTENGKLVTEAFTAGVLSGLTVSNEYQWYDFRTTLALHSQTSLLNQAFGYDAASRLTSVGEGLEAVDYVYLSWCDQNRTGLCDQKRNNAACTPVLLVAAGRWHRNWPCFCGG